MLINSPNISGSLTVTGNSVITGSLTVLGGINATITGSATSASYVEYSNVANKPTLVSGSAQVAAFGFATTGSNQFNGSQAITGSLTVTGQVIAQTLNVQQVTSSIVYSSGSNIFGSSLSDTQQLTGSVSVTGSMNVNGTPVSVGTGSAGQVAFWDGTSSQTGDNGLFWDNSNKRLGIGTSSPIYKLNVHETSDTDVRIQLTNGGTGTGVSNGFQIIANGSSQNFQVNLLQRENGAIGFWTSNIQQMLIASSGNLLLNTTTDAGFRLDVNGTARVQGNLTTNLTAGSVPFIGASGLLSQDNTNLFWDNANKRLGVGTNIPQQKIHAQGTGATTIIAERTGANSAIVGLYASQNPAIIWGESTDFLRFAQIDNTALGGFIERWRIGSTGILQSNGAQTIQTSTGNLTLATAGENGNIVLSPNGTGKVGIGTTGVASFDSVPLLVVGGGTADSGIAIFTSNATAGYLQFADGTSGAEEYRGFIKYDHSTNAMSFSTNSTARTEAEMTILGGGNVGIGTASPASGISTNSKTLHIAHTNVASVSLDNTTQNSKFELASIDVSGGALSIRKNTSAGTSSAIELMRITAAGNVGIGTDSPLAENLLQVSRSVNGQNIVSVENANTGTGAYAEFQARNTNVSNSTSLRVMAMGTGWTTAGGFVQNSGVLNADTSLTGGLSIMTRANADMRFYTNGHTNERMRITAAGNVGIGTDDPLSRLDVNTSTSPLTISNGTTAIGEISYASSGSPNRALTLAGLDGIRFSDSTTERMRITAGGNVGIGTTSPSKRLEIYEDNSSTTSTTGLKITNFSLTTNARAGIVFQSYDNNGAAIWAPRTGSTAGILIFGTNGGSGTAESNIAERMRITSTGNVGINKASPTFKLDILGSDNSQLRLDSSDAADTTIIMDYNGGGSTGRVRIRNANGNLAFNTANSAERMRITSDGYVRLSVNSGGIQFNGDTAAANALDDYEEGTWTPVIRGEGTAGTYELTTAVGHYTKIGRQVTLTAFIRLAGSITGGGTSYLQITGAPFSKGNNMDAVGSVVLNGLDFTGTYVLVKFITVSPTAILFLAEIQDNAGTIDVPISAISANDEISLTITYFV
jgi:hypothetical protein